MNNWKEELIDNLINNIADHTPLDSNNARRGYHQAIELISPALRGELHKILETNFIPKEKKCKDCSTYRKTANNGTRYLCNHFSEPCQNCDNWVATNPSPLRESKEECKHICESYLKEIYDKTNDKWLRLYECGECKLLFIRSYP